MFDSDAAIDEQAVSEYTVFLNRTSIPPFISLLGELESIHGRKIVIDILINLGKHDIQAIAKGLQDNRWFVVRNIIYILRHIGDKKAVEYLLATAKHTDERVRKEAIKTLGDLKNPLALQILRDCLDDAEPSIRKSCGKGIGGHRFRDRKTDNPRKGLGQAFRHRILTKRGTSMRSWRNGMMPM